MLRALITPVSTMQRHLDRARFDPSHKTDLFGALLLGKIYLIDFEAILTDEGPSIELRPKPWPSGPTLLVYTARTRLPRSRNPMDAEVLPFSALLSWIESDTAICIDPGHVAYTIAPRDLEVLRRVAATL